MNICCIGAGYVGGPTMAMIAAKCPEFASPSSTSTPPDRRLEFGPAADIRAGPRRDRQAARGRNLFFSTDVDEGFASAIIFVSVNTPTKTYGIGAGSAADLTNVELCARRIAAVANGDKIVVEKSTLPVRTAESLKRVLHANSQRVQVRDSFESRVPRRGHRGRGSREPGPRAHRRRRHADRRDGRLQKLVDVYARWVPRERILTTNVWSSELSKLVSNALLAQRISSVNALSALCEATGADIDEVAFAAGKDSRIGPKFLKASVGFGGSCFQKDILNLVYLCRHYGLREVADYWQQVVEINDWQKSRFVQRMIADDVQHHRRKADRRARVCVQEGHERHARIGGDRRLPRAARRTGAAGDLRPQGVARGGRPRLGDMPPAGAVSSERGSSARRSLYAAARAPTRSPSSPSGIRSRPGLRAHLRHMNKPAFAFDGRNILPHDAMRALGFEVHAIGKPDPRRSK